MTRPKANIHSSVSQAEEPTLPAIKVRDPLTLTIFGASGDLTARKLMPGLYAMYVHGLLPDKIAIMGSARRDWDLETFRTLMKEAIDEHSRVEVDPEKLASFLKLVFYQKCDLSQDADYAALKERLDKEKAFPENQLFYLAVSPEFFEPVVAQLKKHDLVHPSRSKAWTRVVIEKPFGHDLASAKKLNRAILSHLKESQIYRIDHYLGKETVQNILSFRLANAIFEPLFNNRYVEHVQITAAETVGMEGGRGGYYDTAGALRDMMQNHLLQLFCLVAMEPPSGMDASAIHDEKVKVLKSVKPLVEGRAKQCSVRAQYVGGMIDDKAVPGYLEEERIPHDSKTESYIGVRLDVDNWRWAGVPFCLRTGKRLAKRTTEIAVHFRQPPLQLFQTVECEGDVCDLSRAKPNVLIFRIQPDEGIALSFSAKRPAMQVVVEEVEMDFSYSEAWDRSLPGAYERLLLDVMRGDSTLFTRSDEVEAAWAVVDPILRAWEDDPTIPVATYEPGSWGPAEAEALFDHQHEGWRVP